MKVFEFLALDIFCCPKKKENLKTSISVFHTAIDGPSEAGVGMAPMKNS